MTNPDENSRVSEHDRPVVTQAMIDAGVEALEAGDSLTYSGLVRSVYLAMAAASPDGSVPGVTAKPHM